MRRTPLSPRANPDVQYLLATGLMRNVHAGGEVDLRRCGCLASLREWRRRGWRFPQGAARGEADTWRDHRDANGLARGHRRCAARSRPSGASCAATGGCGREHRTPPAHSRARRGPRRRVVRVDAQRRLAAIGSAACRLAELWRRRGRHALLAPDPGRPRQRRAVRGCVGIPQRRCLRRTCGCPVDRVRDDADRRRRHDVREHAFRPCGRARSRHRLAADPGRPQARRNIDPRRDPGQQGG